MDYFKEEFTKLKLLGLFDSSDHSDIWKFHYAYVKSTNDKLEKMKSYCNYHLLFLEGNKMSINSHIASSLKNKFIDSMIDPAVLHHLNYWKNINVDEEFHQALVDPLSELSKKYEKIKHDRNMLMMTLVNKRNKLA